MWGHRMKALMIAALLVFSFAQSVQAETRIEREVADCKRTREILDGSDRFALVEGPASKQQEGDLALISGFKSGFQSVIDVMDAVLFYELFPSLYGYPEVQKEDCSVKQRGFPFVVAWLVLGGLFCTLRLGFVNIRMFGHGLRVVRNHYLRGDEIGQVTPFQSLAASLSGTIGLGNIAGVAVGITLGGPGAVFWMVVAGFVGMATKFAEVTLGHLYRQVDAEGNISGGAFYYLRDGLRDLKMPKAGKWLALSFAILCLIGAMGGGNMFQANQMVASVSRTFDITENSWIISLLQAGLVGVVLIGGIRRIAQVAEAIVPLMAFIYLTSAIVVLVMHAEKIPGALALIFDQAFSLESATGGIVGAMIMGLRRAAFSCEAGVGSSPIVISTVKCAEPVQAGSIAVLEPFMDTMVICMATALIITVTGVYQTSSADGVMLTSAAFASAISWFPYVLTVAVSLFAFSTMITWSYYGERAWHYLFGDRNLRAYHVIFCLAAFLGGAMQDDKNEGFRMIVDFSDLSLLAMSIPNLIGLFLMSNLVAAELRHYRNRLKSGEIKPLRGKGSA